MLHSILNFIQSVLSKSSSSTADSTHLENLFQTEHLNRSTCIRRCPNKACVIRFHRLPCDSFYNYVLQNLSSYQLFNSFHSSRYSFLSSSNSSTYTVDISLAYSSTYLLDNLRYESFFYKVCSFKHRGMI